MKTIIFFLSFLFAINLKGQKFFTEPPVEPFESTSFVNLKPHWKLDILDTSLIKLDTFDGYNQFKYAPLYGSVVNNGKLYISHVIAKYDLMGFRISCIDIETGRLQWARNIDYDAYQRQHLPMYQTFSKDDDLILIGFRKLYPYDPKENTWDYSSKTPNKLFRIEIDGKTGEIKSYFSPDTNPDFKFSLINHSVNWNILDKDDKGKLEFLFQRFNNNYTRASVDRGFILTNGTVEVVDSFVFSPNDVKTSRTRYAKKDNKYYCIESNWSNKTNFLIVMDTSLNEMNRIDLSHLQFKKSFLEMNNFTQDYMFFSNVYPSTINTNMTIFMLDYNGQVMRKYEIKDDFYSKYSDGDFSYDKKEDKLLIFTVKGVQDIEKKQYTSTVDVLHYDNVEFQLLKTIYLNNLGKVYAPWDVFYVNDDDVIINAIEGVVFYNENHSPPFFQSFGNKTMSVMYVSRKELGLLSAVQEENLEAQRYQVFPNPSIGDFNILLADDMTDSDIRIFDAQGRNVFVASQVNGHQVSLNLRDLPMGSYIYCVYQKGWLIISGQWIKTE